MPGKDAYLDGLVVEIEDLAGRVALVRNRFARQKVNVKLAHYGELEYVRSRFAEFRNRILDLEGADDSEAARILEAAEAARKDLVYAVDSLLAVLS